MTTTFSTVWYLPDENRWLDPLAFDDVGSLTVTEDAAIFTGKKAEVRIANVSRISYCKQGRDFINNWVKIEYDNGKLAFFADGSWLGFGGMHGGTKKILDAVRHLEQRS